MGYRPTDIKTGCGCSGKRNASDEVVSCDDESGKTGYGHGTVIGGQDGEGNVKELHRPQGLNGFGQDPAAVMVGSTVMTRPPRSQRLLVPGTSPVAEENSEGPGKTNGAGLTQVTVTGQDNDGKNNGDVFIDLDEATGQDDDKRQAPINTLGAIAIIALGAWILLRK